MSKIAKISVVKFESWEQILYDFDKTKGLCENVKAICKIIGLPESEVYGLKYVPTNTNEKAHYISETNLDDIKHSDCLKVVFSVTFLMNRIMKNIHDKHNLDLRQIAFDDILKLSADPVFIEKLVESNNDKILIQVFVNDELCTGEHLGLLKTIVQLFSQDKVTCISQNILQKTLDVLKKCDTTSEEMAYALSLLHNILISKNKIFNLWKELIVGEILIADLNSYLVNKIKHIQYGAVLLINTIIGLCQGEKKRQLIKEMNEEETRENIYKYIIEDLNLDKNMEHELFVLQTYLLSLLAEALNDRIDLDDNSVFNSEEFKLCPEDMRRLAIMVDFDRTPVRNFGLYSVEKLAFNDGRKDSSTLMKLNAPISPYSRYFEHSDSISQLTFQALSKKDIIVFSTHYKHLHPRDYYQTQIEEKVYQPGIFYTSESVVKMLAKILHIGKDLPGDEPSDRNSTFYQPLMFRAQKNTFFLELFSITMCQLSRTRREMRASTKDDFPKVLYTLERQVSTALNAKPHSFPTLTVELNKTSFQTVMKKMQEDEEEKMKNLIETNPCIQELKKKFIKENEPNIFQQRTQVLLKGGHFPKVREKKLPGMIFVKLSKNLRDLLVYDAGDASISDNNFIEKFNIADITHIVIGKNCQHSDLCSERESAFSIIVDHEEKIKFIAHNAKTASYWTDALLLLTSQGSSEKLSKYYSEELTTLVEVDIRLQLIELQNVSIPNSPPPIPPLPKITTPKRQEIPPPEPNPTRS